MHYCVLEDNHRYATTSYQERNVNDCQAANEHRLCTRASNVDKN